MNRKITVLFAVLIALALTGTTLALNPHTPGQPPAGPDNPGGGRPEADCGAEPNAPGNDNSAATSPGSPFGDQAGAANHYALEDDSISNPANSNPAFDNSQAPFRPNSQYDEACFQVSNNNGHT